MKKDITLFWKEKIALQELYQINTKNTIKILLPNVRTEWCFKPQTQIFKCLEIEYEATACTLLFLIRKRLGG